MCIRLDECSRRVFFSFYYNKDLSLMWNVRNSSQFKRAVGSEDNARLFVPRDRWETIKCQGDRAIKAWIDDGLRYSGVTVVYIGQYTWQRKWVRYEIEESERQNMGILGVYIHGLRDWNQNLGVKGPNPFNYASISKSSRTYDWVRDRGYENFSDWVEVAARAAGR
jgi:hypothetical protein